MSKYNAASLDLLNIQEFINKRTLQEVTSKITLQGKSELNDDGLFSPKIFGELGSEERINTFAFIDLGTTVMQPFCYGIFVKMNKEFLSILNGEIYFKIEDKRYIKTDSDDRGISGISFFTDNWIAAINYLSGKGKQEFTKTREKNVRTLKLLKPEEIFTRKWIVAPAGIRDVNTQDLVNKGVISYEPINDFYIEIMQTAETIKTVESYELTAKLHLKLYELHKFILENLSGKTGLIRSKSMKKAISYSTRSVLADPNYSSPETWNEDKSNNIRTGDIGISVKLVSSMFFPFTLKRLSDIYSSKSSPDFEEFVQNEVKDHAKLNDGEIIKEFIDVFTQDDKVLKKQVTTFISDGKEIPFLFADWLRHYVLFDIVGRDEPKRFASATRFPYNNLFSNQFLRIKPYTGENIKIYTEDDTGEKIEVTLDIDSLSDAYRLSVNSYEGFGADVDGDTISAIGVFTDDANADIKEKAYFRNKNINGNGQPMAKMGNEILFGLFALTE